jgi:hypothetical protein
MHTMSTQFWHKTGYDSAAAAEPERGLVVGARHGLSGLECAEPHTRRLVQVSNLHCRTPRYRRHGVLGPSVLATADAEWWCSSMAPMLWVFEITREG